MYSSRSCTAVHTAAAIFQDDSKHSQHTSIINETSRSPLFLIDNATRNRVSVVKMFFVDLRRCLPMFVRRIAYTYRKFHSNLHFVA